MKNNITYNSLRLSTIAFAILLLFAYKSPEGEKNNNISVYQEKTNKVAIEDLETIRKRVIDDLLEPAVQPDKIKKLITTIQADGSWPGIDYKDTSKTGFRHSIHLENMLDLARASRLD